MLEACAEIGVAARERNFSLTDVYGAQEAFVTGTFAGLVPVREVDGRRLGSADPAARALTNRLRAAYRALVERDVANRSSDE